MTVKEIIELIQTKQVEFVDVKIVDVPGTWHHITMPAGEIDEKSFREGLPFDGSSLRGFREIEESDMLMVPDPSTAFIDPFLSAKTLSLTCDVRQPGGEVYTRDPRYIAQKAESYLKETGIADTSYFGPELEFFIFDDVRYASEQQGAFYAIDSREAIWNSGEGDGPNLGYKIRNKQGYFPVPPLDTLSDVRTEMVRTLMNMGVRIERHHHEVATAGQAEIGMRFNTLTRMADQVLLYKYVVKNVARRFGKTATFMPKPLFGDNGSGMHTHQSLWKGGHSVFYEEGAYANLSKTARYYIGGILTHAPALLAFTNPSTNSYKRLVPGFEAPVNLVFSQGNRSAAVRIPVTGKNPHATRIEFRTPDSTGNPYLALSAMLMAGLDGIAKKIDPSEAGFGPLDKNTYHLSAEEKAAVRSVPGSLDEVLDALEKDHDFLLQGGVFTEDFIRMWIDYKRENELEAVKLRPHPYEFFLYYDI